MTVETVQSIEIGEAAKQLGIGSKTLFRELRKRGIFDAKNIPLRQHVTDGDFVLVMKQHYIRGHNIAKQYQQAQVTGRGLTLLAAIAKEIAPNITKETPEADQPSSTRAA